MEEAHFFLIQCATKKRKMSIEINAAVSIPTGTFSNSIKTM